MRWCHLPGTGITYMGSTARMLFGMQRNGYMPGVFGKLHPQYAIPRNAMWVSLILGFVFLWVFRGWGHLASVISILHTISYVAGPLAVAGLRRIAPDWHSPCRIPGMPAIALIAFVIMSLIIYWSRWPLTGQVLFVIFAGLFIYLFYQFKNGLAGIGQHLKSGCWLVAYLFVMALLSWLGSTDFGGINGLRAPYDQLAVVVAAVVFYFWGVRSAWNTPLLQQFRQNSQML